MMTDSLERDGP